MYSIAAYGAMIADSVRTDAYALALRQSIRPGAVVLDIGAGTGIFSLLACQYGARRVFAVEPDDAIIVARANAAANGFADRIEFIQDLSTRVTLPEQADVIIADLNGLLPLFERRLFALIDARKRLLAPLGVLIPRQDTIWAAPVEAPDEYSQFTIGYAPNKYDLDLNAALDFTKNTWRRAWVSPEQLLCEPQCWSTLEYATLENINHRAALTWTARRAGTSHGFCVWFDAALRVGASFSNAPGTKVKSHGQAFFPWSQPVALCAGDRMEVDLRADFIGTDYVWSWTSRVIDAQNPGQTKAQFKQSFFFGVPQTPSSLRKQAASHAPSLNEEGEVDLLILKSMNGQTTLGEIARQLREEFPNRFLEERDALTRIGELSTKYSKLRNSSGVAG